jgi:hypothetical protein
MEKLLGRGLTAGALRYQRLAPKKAGSWLVNPSRPLETGIELLLKISAIIGILAIILISLFIFAKGIPLQSWDENKIPALPGEALFL